MSISALLFVVLIHQNLLLVQSLQNDDTVSKPLEDITTLKELRKYIEIILDSATYLKTDLTSGLHDQSVSYVRDGLQELNKLLEDNPSEELKDAHEQLSSEINKCIDEANAIKDAITVKFTDIEKQVNLVLDAIDKDDSLNSESLNDFKNQYKSTVNPYITKFLTKLRSDSESVPLSVKKCVESNSEIVPMLLKSESQFYVLMSDAKEIWLSFTNEKTELTNKIHEDSSSYILQGLGRAQEIPNINVQMEKLDKTAKTIIECGVQADKVIEAAYTKYNFILEDAKRVAGEYAKEIVLKREAVDDTSEEDVNLVKDFKERVDSKIEKDLKSFVKKLKEDSLTVPSKVKNCIDAAVESLRTSALKIEL